MYTKKYEGKGSKKSIDKIKIKEEFHTHNVLIAIS